MGALYISNHNVLYRSANVKPPRILSPLSRLPRNSAGGLEFAIPFRLQVYDDQTLPTDVVVDTIPEVCESLRLRPRG